MVMFQVLMMWMSLIRYCQDSKLFMSTNMVCHIICSFWRFPSSLREVKCGDQCFCKFKFQLNLRLPRTNSPGHAVHSVLIGGWNQETDRWHRRLAAFIIQHPPLVGLRVVQQSALVSSVYCDLEKNKQISDCSTDSVYHWIYCLFSLFHVSWNLSFHSIKFLWYFFM